MSTRKRFVKCEICSFRSFNEKGQKRYFMAQFPLDENRCKQWVKNTGKEDLVYVPIEKLHQLKYLCGQHFKSQDFNRKKNRLKKFAVPSLKLEAPPLSDEMLLDFPFHVFSKTVKSTEPSTFESNSTTFLNLDEEIAGPSHIEPTKMVKQPLLDHNYSKTENIHRPPEKIYTLDHESNKWKTLLDHNYSKVENVLQSPERKNLLNSGEENSPCKRKLMKQLTVCRKKIKKLRHGNILPQIKSLALKTLIKAYIRNNKRKPTGKRWSETEKALALAIYKKSPRTYRHLKHLITLPSERTLQTLLQTFKLEPGISKIILNLLKKQANKLSENDKLCVLLFDELSLKKRLFFNSRTDIVEGFVDLGPEQHRPWEIADHALVFMLQGLHKKIKQPIAYYFTKGTISSQSLATFIKNIIKAVEDSGFNIIATVCDQGPTNIGSMKLLRAWSGTPLDLNYFNVNNKKVYIMYDIPHLFKSLRNNFYNGGELIFNGKKAKWAHLRELIEKNNSTLHFPKLSALHVNPSFKAKMKVKLAAQILSNTVAAVLKLMAENNSNEEKAREILDTAEVVEDLNQLFDCTNGPSSKKDLILKRRENVSKNTNHVKLWSQYKNKLSTMSFLKSDSSLKLKNVRCINGYITSLNTLQDIWHLVQEKGFKYLNLRQLNQDSLENLFNMIRQHCPTDRNPTCHHFTAALKSNILTKLSTPLSKGANCEEDENEAIIDFDDFFKNCDIEEEEQKNAPRNVNFSVMEFGNSEFPLVHLIEQEPEYLQIEDKLFNSFDKQPTVYVAGYLAAVTLKKIPWQCKHCIVCLKIDNPEQIQTKTYSYINLREWWHDKKSLTYPTINLCHLVDIATLCFDLEFKHIINQRNVSNQAITIMLTKLGDLSWICEDHRNQLLHLILIRLSHLLVRNECYRINRSFAEVEENIANVNKKAQQQGIAK